MVLLKDAIKADGYLLHLQQFWLDSGSPSDSVRERGDRGIDARKGGFSSPDSPVFHGKCTPADSSGEVKEADTEAEPLSKVYDGGR